VPEPDDSFELEPDEEDEEDEDDADEPDPDPSDPVFAGAGPSPLEDLPSAPLDDQPSELLAAEAFRALAPRSFFAQPEPLKWIVGAVNALRTSWLPQTGQLVGPAS
jgi:hypothetical protein